VDFVKYISLVEETQDAERRARAQFEEDHKEDEAVYAREPEKRVKELSDLLTVMARAAEYAKHSRSWL
jgi:hypothetical protein